MKIEEIDLVCLPAADDWPALVAVVRTEDGLTADLSQALPPETAVIPRLHRPDGSVTNW